MTCGRVSRAAFSLLRTVTGHILRRHFTSGDLDHGISTSLEKYDMVVSCEGIEHFSNPGLFFSSALAQLNPQGVLVVTTPNTWQPTARIKYLTRGSFPGFPTLAGRTKHGTHMHIMPWNWAQLYLFFSLAGFADITLHPCMGKARMWLERSLSVGMWAYCRKRERKSLSEEERKFWTVAATDGALLSGQLVVSGRKPSN
jgi:SAM-dependent methyltransferase